MNDRELVQMFWDRCETAISDSKVQYGSYCLYIAQNILHDRQDSEECLNDALFAAWNSIPPLMPTNLKTYLGKLTRDISIDKWRKTKARKRIPVEITFPFDELEEMIGESEVEKTVEEVELSTQISEFLRSIKETERNVFVRRYWFYDPIESICLRYGFTKGKVTMMLKRTRDKLADYLKKRGYLI